jgi:hypothetical protein
MHEKITPRHLTKPAYLYLRQSTLGQVGHHRESTERQYALKEKACHLGWPAEHVRILDGDLGISGASGAPSLSLSSVQAVIRAAVNLHAANRNCSRRDTLRAAGLCQKSPQ